MLSRADSVGVFQVESRAQMTMLPRLKPRRFYDLVVEVAIVRPGPIQGGMVHPYLQARERVARGEDPMDGLRAEIRGVLARTLGRTDLPGAGDAARGGGGRLHRWRGRPAAARDGGLAAQGRARALPREAAARPGRQPLRHRLRPAPVPADRGLRQLRLSRIPRRQLRAAGLCLGLAEVLRARRLPRRAAQQPADGLLFALAADPGRAPAWGGGARGGRRRQRLGLHARSVPRPAPRRTLPACTLPACTLPAQPPGPRCASACA